jgi:hypothetical protein
VTTYGGSPQGSASTHSATRGLRTLRMAATLAFKSLTGMLAADHLGAQDLDSDA